MKSHHSESGFGDHGHKEQMLLESEGFLSLGAGYLLPGDRSDYQIDALGARSRALPGSLCSTDPANSNQAPSPVCPTGRSNCPVVWTGQADLRIFPNTQGKIVWDRHHIILLRSRR